MVFGVSTSYGTTSLAAIHKDLLQDHAVSIIRDSVVESPIFMQALL